MLAAGMDTVLRADTSCIEWSAAGPDVIAAAARGIAVSNILLDCVS